jgi:hypothetical protein
MKEQRGKDFPVVCVGGSAGGLDAYIRLLEHLDFEDQRVAGCDYGFSSLSYRALAWQAHRNNCFLI